MWTRLGAILWMASLTLGALGGRALAAPTFESCEARCAAELTERRSHCEGQFPEPEKAAAYEACLNQAKELADGCQLGCNACTGACLTKVMACSKDCPCGEAGPCLNLCKDGVPKCYAYCGVALSPTAVDLAPPPCPDPKPAEPPAEQAAPVEPAEEPKAAPEDTTPVEQAPPPDAPAPSDE